MKTAVTFIVMWGFIIVFFLTGRDYFEQFGVIFEFKDINIFWAILFIVFGGMVWGGLLTIALATTKFYEFIKTVLFGK